MSAAPVSTGSGSSSSASDHAREEVQGPISAPRRRNHREARARLKGRRIVARRYKTPVGEIDLVALKGKRLTFIEVKRRKSVEDVAWTVPAKQRRRIV
jgi:hypothetical protein